MYDKAQLFWNTSFRPSEHKRNYFVTGEEQRVSIPLIGREEILARLEQRLESLKKGYRQNVGLVGPRFIGKTFLLRRFLETASQNPDIVPIYILFSEFDFDGFVERWLGSLLQSFLHSLGLALPEEFQQWVKISKEYIPRTLERMRQVKKYAFQKKYSSAFRELLALTATLREETGKKILLILDEFQFLGSLDLTDPYGLFGKEMMIQKDTFYLVTSSEPQRTKEIFSDRLSLLFGNFEVIEVGSLSQESVKAWVETFSPSVAIPETDLRVLNHLLDNHPYYLELFFQTVRQKSSPIPKQAWDRSFLLESLTDTLFSDHGLLNLHFEFRLQGLFRWGREILPFVKTLLALAHGRAKLFQIAAYSGKKVPETQKTLQRLMGEGMVLKSGSFYVLTDALFRFWLRNVYPIKERELSPGKEKARFHFQNRLDHEIRKIEEEDRKDLTARLESLFREFRNDVVQINQKKVQCPSFLELATRPTNGRFFPILGRTSQGRWFCQVFKDLIHEGDVAGFVEELKRQRKKIQKKVMVALGGIELNAKLMAQEGKIQIWDLASLNALLDLYGKLKIIL